MKNTTTSDRLYAFIERTHNYAAIAGVVVGLALAVWIIVLNSGENLVASLAAAPFIVGGTAWLFYLVYGMSGLVLAFVLALVETAVRFLARVMHVEP